MKNKIIIILLIAVIAVGMLITALNGLNLGLEYGVHKRLRIDFKENFEIEDVRAIAKEVLKDNKIKVSYADNLKSKVIIATDSASDEQVSELEGKLKEKYPSFVNDEEEDNEAKDTNIIEVLDVPSVDLYDIVSIYIKPVIITTLVVILLLGIIFRKLGIVKSFGIPICLILGINLIFVSILAILRIPVNEYIISLGTFIYGISLVIAAIYTKLKCDKVS